MTSTIHKRSLRPRKNLEFYDTRLSPGVDDEHCDDTYQDLQFTDHQPLAQSRENTDDITHPQCTKKHCGRQRPVVYLGSSTGKVTQHENLSSKARSSGKAPKQKFSPSSPRPYPTPPPTPRLQQVSRTLSSFNANNQVTSSSVTSDVRFNGRATPVFPSCRTGKVERLRRAPILFGPNETVEVNARSSDSAECKREDLAWQFNAGSGPLWEMTEDRGWWKEGFAMSTLDEGGTARAAGCKEGQRRPRAWTDIGCVDPWVVIEAT